MEHRWVNSKEFLPKTEEKVLGITKFGGISNFMYTNYGIEGKKPLFSPGGFIPGIDVKWWMPLPTDGWKDAKEEPPKDGQHVLTMGMYGSICDAVYRKSNISGKMEFFPFVWPVLFWREMPELPKKVVLKEW